MRHVWMTDGKEPVPFDGGLDIGFVCGQCGCRGHACYRRTTPVPDFPQEAVNDGSGDLIRPDGNDCEFQMIAMVMGS